jgi:biotin transport system substrate-specific component
MLLTRPTYKDSLQRRVLSIAVFTLLTAIGARLSIPLEPVPFTLQPLAVLLAGLILGARDGAASQLVYVTLIAIGLPLDARGLGSAALVGPTAGYLVGFVVCAFVTGLLAQGDAPVWRRWLAGAAGILALYAIGVPVLALVANLGPQAAWNAGAAPYLIPDLAKAAIAAGLAEGGRAVLARFNSV